MPADLAAHPSDETLRALNLGKLNEAESQTVFRHVEICPECCRRAAALPGDSFLGRLRAVHTHAPTLAQGETPRGASGASQAGPPAGNSTENWDLPLSSVDSRPTRFPEGLPAAFGRYRVLKLLGKGGMGAVYLAHDTRLYRPVALKMPHFDADDGPQVRERFFREARAAATVSHPNICPLYDVGEVGGAPFLTMAYIEGRSLAEYAAAHPLTPRQGALLVRKLALALQEAHKCGVLHRDLKPANVMIDRRGEPIVMDFGLARRTGGRDPRLTQRGSLLGTPAYMPPEQIGGDADAAGPAGDVYSLGVMFYELLTGRLPFQGDSKAIMSQALLNEPPRPSALRPGLDPALEAVCLKAMARRVEDRYASMEELAAALTALRPQTSSAPPPAPRVGRRRLPLWAWLVGVGVAAALVEGALWAGALNVFRVNTADGVYEVEVNEPNADVFIDKERATVSWDDGGKKAEIRVKPGTHMVEVKKDGVTAYGQEVAVGEGGRTSVVARFDGPAAAKDAPGTKLPQVAEAAADRGEEMRKIHWARRSGLYSASFSPDGRRLLISGDGDVTLLYDAATGRPVGQPMRGYVSVFMPGGKEILVGQRDGSVFRVYDMNGQPLREFHGKDLLDIYGVSSRGDRLLSVSPGVDRLMDVKDGRIIKEWACDTNTTYLFFTPDGQSLFRQENGQLPWRVYRADDGAEVQAFDPLTRMDGLRGFFPDGHLAYGLTKNHFVVYAVNSGKKNGGIGPGAEP